MRLSCKVILNYSNINNFSYGNQWIVRAGDPNTLYFQIVDLDQSSLVNLPGQNLLGSLPIGSLSSNFPGLRYMVGIGSSNEPYAVTVVFPSIDNTKVISLNAVQADPADSSIWKVSILSSQTPNTGNVQFSVAEGTNIRRFSVMSLIAVEFPSNGSC